jgi:hypothetical protein
MTDSILQIGLMVLGGLVSGGILVLAGVCVRALVRVSDRAMIAAERQRVELGQSADRQRRDADAMITTIIEKLQCSPDAAAALHSAERQQRRGLEARLQEASQVKPQPMSFFEEDMEDLGEPTDDPSLAQGV